MPKKTRPMTPSEIAAWDALAEAAKNLRRVQQRAEARQKRLPEQQATTAGACAGATG